MQDTWIQDKVAQLYEEIEELEAKLLKVQDVYSIS